MFEFYSSFTVHDDEFLLAHASEIYQFVAMINLHHSFRGQRDEMLIVILLFLSTT